MDAIGQTLPLGKSARLRRWLARRWVAIVAVVVVAVNLGIENCQFHEYIHYLDDIQDKATFYGYYGWPQISIEAHGEDVWHFRNVGLLPRLSWAPLVMSWSALLIDLAVAIALSLITWFVLRRTQRECERWYHFSLATLLALVALATILCAIWNYEPALP